MRPSFPLTRSRSLARGALVAAAVTGAMLAAAGLGGRGPVAGVLRDLGLIAATSPPNDDFVAAVPVTGTTFSGTTEGAGVEAGETAAGAAEPGERTVWFRWTAAASGWTTVVADAPDDDPPAARVWVGESLADLESAEAPERGAPPSTGPAASGVTIAALEGTTYSISIVSPPGSDGGSFTFSLWRRADVANDEPAAAVALDTAISERAAAGGGRGFVVSGATAGASAADGEASVGGSAPQRSVWYRFTGPIGGGTVTLSVERWAPGSRQPGGLRLGAHRDGAVVAAAAGGPLAIPTEEGVSYLVSVDGDATYFDLFAATSGVQPEDRTPPVVSCTAVSGWSGGTVAVPCTASDAGVGLADGTEASFNLAAAVAAGLEADKAPTDTREVCDRAGNCATAGPVLVKIDSRPPQVRCDAVPTVWSATDQRLTCRAADGGSGLADPADRTRTIATAVTAGAEETPTVPGFEVCDAVGNCTGAGPFGPFKVDKKPPTATCGAPPAGWQRDDVVITCAIADGGAGLAGGQPPSIELRTDVGSGVADADALTGVDDVCDAVGNCAPAGPVGPIAVDRSPPAVPCTRPSEWFAADATVACSATDDGSGLADPAAASFGLTASLAPGQEDDRVATTSRDVCDVAGNCTTAGPVTVKIDRRPPERTCASPPAGWSADDVELACTSSDAGSGVSPGNGVSEKGLFSLQAAVPAGSSSAAVTSSTQQVCDRAGNCATAGPVGPLRIDRKAPSVTCEAPPSGSSSRVNVRATCTAADDGAGMATDDAEAFALRTSVRNGDRDSSARTTSRRACDAVGNCTAAGPFGPYDVDRRSAPGPAPSLAGPEQVTAVAAVPNARPVVVPYTLPVGGDSEGNPIETACRPGNDGTFRPGWTVVACGATDAAERIASARFPLLVVPLPALAPTGGAEAGKGWRAVGVGFAPSSDAPVEIDGAVVTTAKASEAGTISRDFVIPASTPPGAHLMVVRGQDTSGRELLVVTPFSVVAEGAGLDAAAGGPSLPPPSTTTTQPTPSTPTTRPPSSPPTVPPTAPPATTPTTTPTATPTTAFTAGPTAEPGGAPSAAPAGRASAPGRAGGAAPVAGAVVPVPGAPAPPQASLALPPEPDGRPPSSSGSAAAPRPASGTSAAGWQLIAAAVATAAILGGAVMLLRRRRPHETS